jgi:hypothetical protein
MIGYKLENVVHLWIRVYDRICVYNLTVQIELKNKAKTTRFTELLYRMLSDKIWKKKLNKK